MCIAPERPCKILYVFMLDDTKGDDHVCRETHKDYTRAYILRIIPFDGFGRAN